MRCTVAILVRVSQFTGEEVLYFPSAQYFFYCRETTSTYSETGSPESGREEAQRGPPFFRLRLVTKLERGAVTCLIQSRLEGKTQSISTMNGLYNTRRGFFEVIQSPDSNIVLWCTCTRIIKRNYRRSSCPRTRQRSYP